MSLKSSLVKQVLREILQEGKELLFCPATISAPQSCPFFPTSCQIASDPLASPRAMQLSVSLVGLPKPFHFLCTSSMTSPRSLHPSSPLEFINTLVPHGKHSQAAKPCELGQPHQNEQVYLQGPVGFSTIFPLALLDNLICDCIRWDVILSQIWHLSVLSQRRLLETKY